MFAGVLAAAGIASWHLAGLLPWPLYWGLTFCLALGLSLLSRRHPGSTDPGGSPFLCDRCKYNYPSACNRPERPNATSCADFRPPG